MIERVADFGSAGYFAWNNAQYRWECRAQDDHLIGWLAGEMVHSDNRSLGAWLAMKFDLGLMP